MFGIALMVVYFPVLWMLIKRVRSVEKQIRATMEPSNVIDRSLRMEKIAMTLGAILSAGITAYIAVLLDNNSFEHLAFIIIATLSIPFVIGYTFLFLRRFGPKIFMTTRLSQISCWLAIGAFHGAWVLPLAFFVYIFGHALLF